MTNPIMALLGAHGGADNTDDDGHGNSGNVRFIRGSNRRVDHIFAINYEYTIKDADLVNHILKTLGGFIFVIDGNPPVLVDPKTGDCNVLDASLSAVTIGFESVTVTDLSRILNFFFNVDFKHGLDSFASVTQLVRLIELHVEQLYLNYAHYGQLKRDMDNMSVRLNILKSSNISVHPLKQVSLTGVTHSE